MNAQMEMNSTISGLSREIKGLHIEIAAMREVVIEQSNAIKQLVNIQDDQPSYLHNPKQQHGLEERISNLLLSLNVPPNLIGYVFLKEAISMVYNGLVISGSLTKVLYPTIAKKYNTAPNRVERGIRHAIEISWIKTRHALLADLMNRPTNAAFIALVAEKLRLEANATEE